MRVIAAIGLVVLGACNPDSATREAPAVDVSQAADAPALPPALAPVAWSVAGHFTNEKNKAASELSGGACAPASADGSRTCVFVNDENRNAQLATIKDGVITPGAMIDLLSPPPVLGREPVKADVECGVRTKPSEEFDGEAVAYAAPYFYVIGSHGCSRKKFELSPTAFILARIKADPGAAPVVERTYRVADILRLTQGPDAAFGKQLQPKEGETVDANTYNGLNIEGFAVANGRALIGLRAPAEPGKAYIVSTPVDDLFVPGADAASGKGDVITLDLAGETVRLGIRDVVALEGGRILALVGPAQEQLGAGYTLWVAGLDPAASARKVADVPAPAAASDAKAEGLVLVEQTAAQARVLLLHDGLEYSETSAPAEMIVGLN